MGDIPRASTLHVAGCGLKSMIVAEVGVRGGENAVSLLSLLDIQRLYLVDHYPDYSEGGRNFTNSEQLGYWIAMFKNIKPFQQRVTLIHQPSTVAACLFEDEIFDMVYIDADHRFDQVIQDIRAWWPRVKKGGFLCGHDFHRDWPGVQQAVKQFTQENGLEFIQKGISDWIIPKHK